MHKAPAGFRTYRCMSRCSFEIILMNNPTAQACTSDCTSVHSAPPNCDV